MPTPLPAITVPDATGLINIYRQGHEDLLAGQKRDLMKQAGGLAAAGNYAGARSALYKGGEFGEAYKMSDELRSIATHARTMSNDALERGLKSYELLGRVTDTILKDPNPQAALDAAKARLGKLGLNVNGVTLEQLPQLRQQGVSVQQQLENERAERNLAAEQEQRKQAQANADRSFGLQEKQFTAGREDSAATQLYRNAELAINQQKANALAKKLNAPKPLTESQATASAYLKELEGANSRLQGSLGDNGESPLNDTLDQIAVAKYTPTFVSNRLLNKKERQFLQSVEQFASVLLYKRSGAQISPEEFSRVYRTYFPQPGDDGQTRLQKLESRKEAIEGVRVQSGAVPNGAQPGVEDMSDEDLMKNFQ